MSPASVDLRARRRGTPRPTRPAPASSVGQPISVPPSWPTVERRRHHASVTEVRVATRLGRELAGLGEPQRHVGALDELVAGHLGGGEGLPASDLPVVDGRGVDAVVDTAVVVVPAARRQTRGQRSRASRPERVTGPHMLRPTVASCGRMSVRGAHDRLALQPARGRAASPAASGTRRRPSTASGSSAPTRPSSGSSTGRSPRTTRWACTTRGAAR